MGSLSYFPLKKWQCSIYFIPRAKLAICLKKREREERVHITFCVILSVSLAKNVRSFTWTNPVHLNMFVNLRAIHMCCFLPLPMQFCPIPCQRRFPCPYQIQYLLKNIAWPLSFICLYAGSFAGVQITPKSYD